MRARGELIPRRHPCTMTRKTTKGHTLITTYLHLFTKFLHAHQALPPGLSNPTSFALDNFSLAFGWLSYWYVRLVFGDGASCCARLLSHLYCGVGGGGLGWWVGSENVPAYMHTDTYTHRVDLFLHLHRHTHTGCYVTASSLARAHT